MNLFQVPYRRQQHFFTALRSQWSGCWLVPRQVPTPRGVSIPLLSTGMFVDAQPAHVVWLSHSM